MSEASERTWAEPATSEPDPVIDAYKKDVDRTLLRANLGRTVEERLQNLVRLQRFGDDLRRAGRPKDLEAIAELEALREERRDQEET